MFSKKIIFCTFIVLYLRCFARSRTSLNNAFSHLGACLTTVTFRKVEFSNPSRTRNCMVTSTRECDKTRWCRSCIPFTIPSAVKTPSQLFLRDGSSSPSLSLSLSVSLVFSRIPANAGSTSHFWILIPPGRRITRPSAYDFIRGG